ncbi:dimethylguanosine tRNA methyltransferase [Cryptosporidium ubiquitum]|uniref:tRNA (guanine(26)-N(2))-dimethyltransferase n=1 Tax=Cryptosporidium ubiquitum TaxID=857276 RepID=A0A1J4MD49_9CRYT|nr:dimethylguanosine tRNA methyltransferase [Cryptosporidium ubiquitum]OII72153.1 dimethylguanosine tRNA methyltransferase [Cryptosporidium ubiquitum]
MVGMNEPCISSEPYLNKKFSEFICEGKVKIHKMNDDVFYNPAQVFNRDLSLIAIKSFLALRRKNLNEKYFKRLKFAIKNDGDKSNEQNNNTCSSNINGNADLISGKNGSSRFPITVLEPLGASGLRSIRYIKELATEIDHVVCGDIDPVAVERMQQNFELNSIPPEKYSCICADARKLLSLSTPSLIRQIKSPNQLSVENIINSLLGGGKKISSSSDPVNSGFTIVDIDPYGTCAPFIDGTVHACEEEGLACFTATDMPVLCGNVPEVTFYKYGGNALKKSYGHEMSLRLLLNTIITTAAKYQKSIIPLLSVSVDFYVRVFVKVKTSAIRCKDISSTTGFVLQCTNCPSFHVINFGDKVTSNKKRLRETKKSQKRNRSEQLTGDFGHEDEKPHLNTSENEESRENNFQDKKAQNYNKFKYKAGQLNINLYKDSLEDLKCKECSSGKYCIGGPIYTGNLCDDDFLVEMLNECKKIEEFSINNCNHSDNNTEDISADHDILDGVTMNKKIKGLLTAIRDELKDCVLHYHIPSLCNFLGIEMIRPLLFHSALRHLGYKSSHFHRDPLSLKTNAPNKVVMDILRSWALLNPSKNKKNNSFLDVQVTTEGIKFDIHPDVLLESKASYGPRWLPNPEANWGPISRPKNAGQN